MASWYFDSFCEISLGGTGPWDDHDECFSNVKKVRKNCLGFQTRESKLNGKINWRYTEIEIKFTNCFNQNIDKWFYDLTGGIK